MGNFFNDLNKMVNTIQKVDKLLTEKPKRAKTKYITKRFTEEEFKILKNFVWYYHSNHYWRMTEEELKLYNKFK